MSIFDGYRREERKRTEPGDYRVSIVGVEEKESQAGNPMLVVAIQPNGSDIRINHYIVKNEYFNRNLTDLFDSFGIEEGNYETLSWIGAVGGAKLREDKDGYLKVQYFLSPERQDKLPPWEGDLPERQKIHSVSGSFEELTEEDLPF